MKAIQGSPGGPDATLTSGRLLQNVPEHPQTARQRDLAMEFDQGRKAALFSGQYLIDHGLQMLVRLAGTPDRAFSTAELVEEFMLSRHY